MSSKRTYNRTDGDEIYSHISGNNQRPGTISYNIEYRPNEGERNYYLTIEHQRFLWTAHHHEGLDMEETIYAFHKCWPSLKYQFSARVLPYVMRYMEEETRGQRNLSSRWIDVMNRNPITDRAVEDNKPPIRAGTLDDEIYQRIDESIKNHARVIRYNVYSYLKARFVCLTPEQQRFLYTAFKSLSPERATGVLRRRWPEIDKHFTMDVNIRVMRYIENRLASGGSHWSYVTTKNDSVEREVLDLDHQLRGDQGLPTVRGQQAAHHSGPSYEASPYTGASRDQIPLTRTSDYDTTPYNASFATSRSSKAKPPPLKDDQRHIRITHKPAAEADRGYIIIYKEKINQGPEDVINFTYAQQRFLWTRQNNDPKQTRAEFLERWPRTSNCFSTHVIKQIIRYIDKQLGHAGIGSHWSKVTDPNVKEIPSTHPGASTAQEPLAPESSYGVAQHNRDYARTPQLNPGSAPGPSYDQRSSYQAER